MSHSVGRPRYAVESRAFGNELAARQVPVASTPTAQSHQPLSADEPYPSSSRGRPSAAALPTPTATLQAWQHALATSEPRLLLRLNGFHLAQFPKLAPAFADLKRELRFCDLGDEARAAFIAEALATLRDSGAVAARDQCLRATAQLRDAYDRRHRSPSRHDPYPLSPEEGISDDEAAWWREAHKWGC